jgi:prefoldin subunit 5
MSNLPGIIQAVFGVAAVVAAGVAAMLLGSVKTLREAIGDRDKRINGLEGRLSDCESALAKEQAARAATATELDALRKVVTGEAHWQAIEEQVDELQRQSMRILGAIGKVADLVRGKPKGD